MAIFQGNAISSASGDFDIPYSCRFNDDDNAYLNRTPGSSGNRKTWTVSFWMKRGNQQANVPNYDYTMFGIATDDGRICFSNDDGGDCLRFTQNTNPSFEVITKRKLRDHSAWYHIVIAVDTTQPTPADRIRVHVNGDSQETNFVSGKETYPSQHDDLTWNHTVEHGVGRTSQYSNRLYDGYLAEIHWVDGTALYPDSFGERGDYGEWKPKRVSGLTYGTTGFYLDFSNGAALGDDAAGSNDFTVNNITANDQMPDTPTNNFCTWDGVNSPVGTLSEGNLKVVGTTYNKVAVGTFPMSSGKWYWEVQVVTNGTRNFLGVAKFEATPHGSYAGGTTDAYAGVYGHDGATYQRGGTENAEFGSSFSAGDIITICFDADIGSFWLNKNAYPDTSATALVTSLPSGLYNLIYEEASGGAKATNILNAGQDGTFAGTKTAQDNADDNGYGNFYYDVPAGFLALCSKNLPEPTVEPSEHFNTVLYTDNASIRSITGVGFQPDLVWIKTRNHGNYHNIFDSLRGVGKTLHSSTNGVEDNVSDLLTSFDSDGFGLGADASGYGVNHSNKTEVAWNWKANGSGSSNTDGTINTTSTSANVSAGFSISTYTGNGVAGATVGHGLSVAPELVIVKRRDNANNWAVGQAEISGKDWTGAMKLDATEAWSADNRWNNTPPTNSVFSLSSDASTNNNTSLFIAYCWHSVEGYSKIGAYEGNGNADGTVVYCGFRPAFVMTKTVDSSGQNWMMFDNKRDTYNLSVNRLRANDSAAEGSDNHMDILSNGFKLRTSDQSSNGSESYVYMAFAENPFRYTNAR